MANSVVNKILEKTGQKKLLDILAYNLSSSQLNSLLMEVYRIKTDEISPTELLHLYGTNRFVQPASSNLQEHLRLEMCLYNIAESFSFIPLDLPPVAILGSCSVMAPVNQNKVISALRGTEVVADATNSMALHICSLKKDMKPQNDEFKENFKFCNIHHHIRTQQFTEAGFRPHFKVFSLVTSGRDHGSYNFEIDNILEHITVYKKILNELFNIRNIKIKLIESKGFDAGKIIIREINKHLKKNMSEIVVDIENRNENDNNQYYRGIQFKLSAIFKDSEYEIIDGGFVNWSQQLLSDKKERLLTSGLGLDFLINILNENIPK